MKKALGSLMILVLLVLITSVPAFAGGDKVRGENGQGAVTQVQVENPPPFQP